MTDLVGLWEPRPLSDIQLLKTGVMLELGIHGVQEFSQERLLSRGSLRRETLSKKSQAEKEGIRVAHSKFLDSDSDTADRIVVNRLETTFNERLRIGGDKIFITLIRAGNRRLGCS